MTFSEKLDLLAPALVACQAVLPNLPASEVARITTKGGGSFSYAYTPLEVMIPSLRQVLHSHGVCYVQGLDTGPEDGTRRLSTMLIHESGQWISTSWVLDGTTDATGSRSTAQEWGSVVTYFRRYQLAAILGLVSEEDRDGAQQEEKAKGAARKRRRQSNGSASKAPAQQSRRDAWVDSVAEAAGLTRAQLQKRCYEITGTTLEKLDKETSRQLLEGLKAAVAAEEA